MRTFPFFTQTLSAQLILWFVVIILLTVVASWFPEIWLIRAQLDRQAWAQVDQGRRAANALYRSWQGEVDALNNFVVQLPRLQEFHEQQNYTALQGYVTTLHSGLVLDLIVVCDGTNRVVAQAGAIATEPCQFEVQTSEYIVLPATPQPQAWLLAVQPLQGSTLPGKVMVGIALDNGFARQMDQETGLQHTILADGRQVATSFPIGSPPQLDVLQRVPQDEMGQTAQILTQEGTAFYAKRLAIASNLEDEMALNISSIQRTERQLIRTQFTSLTLVILAGIAVAVVLARYIGRPLSQLAGAATRFHQGDLDHHVAVSTHVHEVTLVAEALEDARRQLQRTLTDLQQEKAWMDHLLSSIVEGIMTIDAQERITFWSQGAEQITGWSQAEVLNRNCNEILQPLNPAAAFSTLIPQSDQRRRVVVRLADDTPATLSISRAELVPLEAKEARLALVFRDVSEEEAVHRLLGHFMANMTHEFRTPLAALSAAVELLLDQSLDLSQAEMNDLLGSLYLGVLGLQTLVDNLLESASLETGMFRVSPQPTDLPKLITEVSSAMRPLFRKYNQDFQIDLSETTPLVQADPRRTMQVLVNLLSNASRYAPADTQVTIRVTTEDAVVRVMVLDQGPGVPEVHHDLLFRRFAHFGSNQETASSYGTGLGLWVVKSIVEAQGGRVGVEQQEGGGSVFWFTLPVAEEV